MMNLQKQSCWILSILFLLLSLSTVSGKQVDSDATNTTGGLPYILELIKSSGTNRITLDPSDPKQLEFIRSKSALMKQEFAVQGKQPLTEEKMAFSVQSVNSGSDHKLIDVSTVKDRFEVTVQSSLKAGATFCYTDLTVYDESFQTQLSTYAFKELNLNNGQPGDLFTVTGTGPLPNNGAPTLVKVVSYEKTDVGGTVTYHVLSEDVVVGFQNEVNGSVLNQETGKPISNATIRIGNQQTTSDAKGLFSVRLPSSNNPIRIKVSSLGYAPYHKPLNNLNAQKIQLKIPLVPFDVRKEINPSNMEGNIIRTQNGAAIKIPERFDIEENLNVSIKNHNLSNQDIDSTPGDFKAIDKNGIDSNVISLGMIDMMIQGTVTGKEYSWSGLGGYEITIPITGDLSIAPTTIPLWYYDKNQGKWIEEGSATLNNGLYHGTVSRFSAWSVGLPKQDMACIAGQLEDPKMEPGDTYQLDLHLTGFKRSFYQEGLTFQLSNLPTSTEMMLTVTNQRTGITAERLLKTPTDSLVGCETIAPLLIAKQIAPQPSSFRDAIDFNGIIQPEITGKEIFSGESILYHDFAPLGMMFNYEEISDVYSIDINFEAIDWGRADFSPQLSTRKENGLTEIFVTNGLISWWMSTSHIAFSTYQEYLKLKLDYPNLPILSEADFSLTDQLNWKGGYQAKIYFIATNKLIPNSKKFVIRGGMGYQTTWYSKWMDVNEAKQANSISKQPTLIMSFPPYWWSSTISTTKQQTAGNIDINMNGQQWDPYEYRKRNINIRLKMRGEL